MGSRLHNNFQIFAAYHLFKLMQDCYKYSNGLTLLDVEIVAINANNNFDVIACFTQTIGDRTW